MDYMNDNDYKNNFGDEQKPQDYAPQNNNMYEQNNTQSGSYTYNNPYASQPSTPAQPAQPVQPAQQPYQNPYNGYYANSANPQQDMQYTGMSGQYTQQQYSNQNSGNLSYYPPNAVKPKKAKRLTWLKATGAVAAIAAISIMSIGAYAALTGGPNYRYDDSIITSTPAETEKPDKTNPIKDNDVTQGNKDNASAGDKQQSGSSAEQSKPVNTSPVTIYQAAALENALSIPEIVSKVTPSVVGISSEFVIGNYSGTGTGTGIIMSQDGYIITNAHVIENSSYGSSMLANSIMVLLSDQTEYEAKIVGYDTKTDLAVLKIEATGLSVAEFGNSDDLQVGELAVAIGNPLGFELYGTVTGGLISGLNRTFNNESTTISLIQTSAQISPGNSGGPLVNSYGQVIGINSSKISGNAAEGIGFAIPINDAVPIIDDLINVGYVTGRPAIGISGEDISALWARYYNIPMGVNVRFISPDSGAEKAGIKAGDIIIGINGQSITCMSELNAVKDKFAAGDTVTLTIFRDGQDIDIDVTLSEETK